MTISTTESRVEYVGNGVSTYFPIPFRFLENAHIKAVVVTDAGEEAQLILNVNYTLTGADDEDGGGLTLTGGPLALLLTLIIYRQVPVTQETDYISGDPFPAESHERALDKLTMIAQQTEERIGRTLDFPISDLASQIGELPPAAARANSILSFDANGRPVAIVPDSQSAAGLAIALAAADGASLIGFRQAGVGAVNRTVQDKLREVAISVKDFGAVGDGVTDDTVAFLTAITYMQQNAYHRGGVLYVPRGQYLLYSTLVFTAYLGEHNIYLRGDGINNTVLDFAGTSPNTDGIAFGSGAQFGIEDIGIRNIKRDGISIRGASLGVDNYASLGYIRNVRVEAAVRDGIRQQNTYMISMEDIWCKNNGTIGYNFIGFHTSIHAKRCWANAHGSAGWSFNGMIYSAFEACASDSNMWGWQLSNMRGVVFTACGSEETVREAIIVRTSDASVGGIPPAAQNIEGVIFNGFYILKGNMSAGPYPTMASLATANNRPINITFNGCVSLRANVADVAIVADGVSGRITIHEDAPNYDSGAATVTKTGDVMWEGRPFQWFPAIVGLTSTGTCDYQQRSGTYCVRDGICWAHGDLDWTGHTGTGNASVAGLPHMVQPTRNPRGFLDLRNWSGITGRLGCYANGSTTDVRLVETIGSGAPSFIPIDAAAGLSFSVTYPVQ